MSLSIKVTKCNLKYIKCYCKNTRNKSQMAYALDIYSYILKNEHTNRIGCKAICKQRKRKMNLVRRMDGEEHRLPHTAITLINMFYQKENACLSNILW